MVSRMGENTLNVFAPIYISRGDVDAVKFYI
jgi:hypothetical protein